MYHNLLNHYFEREKKPNKVVACQKCGNAPYELTMRFAGCNLGCGLCFASNYSWPSQYLKSRTVTSEKTVEDAVRDFEEIPLPEGFESYNWLRILGGEPLLNDEYIEFLFQTLLKICTHGKRFNNGVIIQTNGIHVGRSNTGRIKSYLQELFQQNPSVIVAIETSIKGTNPEEFGLLTRTRSDDLFKFNLDSYFNLRSLSLPNLQPTVVAGFGPNERFLLRQGESKDKMTVTLDGKRPCFHPDLWNDDFSRLYEDFTSVYRDHDPMFSKMPMYGLKDRFDLGWVKRAIRQGKEIYGEKFYDSKYATARNAELEDAFNDLLGKFFFVDNQSYYSALIRH